MAGEQTLQPLLETLEAGSASQTEQTDAYLTLANRLSGEEGKEFTAVVGKQFPRVCKLFKKHIIIENSDLSNAALQALGFCVFNSKIASGISVSEIRELLTTLNSIATKSSDKNTCTRALWVIAKQCFPSEEVGKMVPDILSTLETVLNRGDVQSMVIEYEALNIVIRLLEQTPVQMGEEAGRWAKLIVPLVVHSAPRVRLRGATALEMGMPLLLRKQQDVAAITEPLMSTKIISELQRLFSTKNETYVLKLWPLFVKLLGKTLHRSGSFINSLLQLEELGFRSGSPVIKKIAFIAWKSLIDNFALNPEILASSKRLKLLMQPLCSIHVRTETLALTKLEVWWYLLIRLGPQLSANFEQVCTPLIQNALSVDATSAVPGTPASRSANQSLTQMTPGTKSGNFSYVSPTTPRMNLNSSSLASAALPSIQLLGLEMLLHFLLGPEVGAFATKHNLVLGLEPLQHPLISNPSFFCKHASTLMNAVQDGFIAVGKDASDAILQVIWKEMISLVKAAIEAGNKRDRQGSDVLPLLLQALKNIVIADALPAQKTLALIESTIKGLPQKALGSPAYQVANMDLLNGTPALFLIQLLFHDGLLEHCEVEERFFICLETLVNCVLSGPTSPLAFSESVLGVLGQNAKLLENKEHLWRMWSIIVNPLTERITQTNEVNQGDALEHNFSALHIALTLPVNHLFPAKGFPQPTMKSLLRTWSELYKAFARCAALVTTTEENVCCEELGAKILSGLGEETLTFSTLDGIVQSLLVMVESINFSPYSTKYLPKVKAPQTPTDWAKKKHEPLGNLTSLLKLVVKLIDSFHTLACKELTPEIPTSAFVSVGCNILGILTTIISHISLTSIIKKLFQFLTKPLAVFYEKTSKSSDVPKAYSSLSNKLEKLLGEIFLCLQSRYSGAYDSELLSELSPLLSVVFLHKNKQIRNQMSQFWNATFAKTTVLVYPAELKTVLSQVRQKTPIILPGFESVEVEEVSSGPYSDPNENFQMDTKISGMEVKSSGKRDSILAQSEDRKENGTPKRSKQAKLKLEFSSPKVKTSDKFLEEERTMDFVFIPPETKQRVLTEHQKEVLKTKRVIPTMYNNLDASQDAILFSQYTQSQEDSLEKPAEVQIEAGTEKQTKAEAKESREQKMETATVAEKGEMKYLSEDGHLNESINKAHPGDVSIGENTSAGSNCSTSDMVSDTPPQPVSRRQSFITLEKFDPSGSKHFSPATLSTQPGTLPVSVLNQLEVKDSPENQENPAEKCGVGIKNFSESKAEKTAFKARHTSKQMQIKESNQGANKDVAENSVGIVASEECKFNEHHVQPEDTQCIPDTQVAESSLMLTEEKVKQAERDNETEADIESKENKPPGGESFDLKHNQVTLDQNINSNQKSLRRSSRRRLEISEFGNTDKEKSDHNKKDKNVEDEKPVQKESQTKNEDLQGYKTLSEKLDEYENVGYSKQGNENSVLNNINKQEALPEEVIPSSKESLRDCKPEVSTAQDSASDKAVEEKTTHPRYKTRRASLVTLAGTENSESDSSESREEITNKKGTMRAKPKTSTSGFKDEQFQSLEISTSRILAEKEPSTNMETRIASSTETDMEVTIITQSSVVKDKCKTDYSSVEECSGLKDTGTMLIKQDTSKDGHITNVIGSTYSELCTSEPAVQSAQSNKTYDVQSSIEASTKTESLLTEPMLGDFSTASSDVFAQTDSSLSDIECRHKRSKRLRKSKGCDCCTGQLQEKTVVESKGSEKRILKLDDKAKKTKLTHLSAEEESCVDEQFDDTVFVGPSAMSTPLLTNKKPRFFKASAIERKSTADSEEENTVVHQNATSVDTDQTTETLKTNKHLNSLLPEKPGLNSKMCESCPVAELDSNIPPQRDCTPLVCECDQLASVVQCNKVETQGPVEGVAEVIGENARKTKAQELIPEHGQNKKISSSTPFETSLSTSDEIKGPMPATEAESDSAVFDSVTIADEAIEGIAIPGEQTVQTIVTLVEQPMVGIADSREQATARTITSGEPAAVAKSANGEQAALDIATSGEHSVVPNTVEQAVVDIPTSGDSGEQIFTSEESVVMDIACPGEPALVALNNVGSPPKFKGLEGAALVSLNGSPGEVQSRCIWSPSASPSTSILKKGLKRPQEDDSPSPINKIRRVSFADPIYKEELADDIDRRSPVVRNGSSSSSSSPTTKSLKMSPNVQNKLMTTPTKGFISSGSRLGPKSSKKCLITEMAKESLPSPRESVYPALVNCTTPVDVILPQITSNMWARGLGQLIRAKNIKTVGDLSALTISEIKTLPIRSPKISTVKKALRMIHEQQMKSRGYEEIVPLEEVDKQVNGLDEIASSATEDERLSPVLPEPPSTLVDANPSIDVMAKIDALAVQLTPEELCHYSASRLFEMHEKLTGMTSCLMRSLQARWTSPPHKSST